ncbi:MAG TPA: amidophosphoribosyltransferase [Candidatus Subteraquimicrobiales bacterium]
MPHKNRSTRSSEPAGPEGKNCPNPQKEFREECGVFGIYAPGEDVAKLTYFGLHALQHRGQESAGIAVADGNSILIYKDMGLVPQVFDEQILTGLQGHVAIGHVRYSTTGSTSWKNSQPIHRSSAKGSIALSHNGNLTNAYDLKKELQKNGSRFESTVDSEVIAGLIAEHYETSVEEAVKQACPKLKGAYSLVILSENSLMAVRDPYGIRPLCLGQLGDGYVISSETCGLDIVGAQFVREVHPGELIIIDEDGIRSEEAVPPKKSSLCIFEFIYFARPDSQLYGRSLYHARLHMGISLAKEAFVPADLVVPVPDSGTSAAIGYAQASGIPFGEGLIKNRYVGRTFIEPNQTIRQRGIKLKLNPLKETIRGKRLVVVDDSIVRGNTSKEIVRIFREAGAKEIHVRASSPPVKCPCFYGIDTANQLELIASNKSVEEVRKFLGADSLSYLSQEALVESTKRSLGDFCLACFNGCYPLEVPKDLKITKFMLEEEEASEMPLMVANRLEGENGRETIG